MRVTRSRLGQIIAAAIVGAAVAALVAAPASAGRARGAARHHARGHHAGHEPRRLLRLNVPGTDDFSRHAERERDVAIAGPAPLAGGRPGSIDYRLAPRGPVGSIGLLRPTGVQPPAGAYVGPAASLRRGYPEVTAGARLSYPF